MMARYRTLAEDAKRRVTQIDPAGLAREMEAGAVLIDVREPDETREGMITGARLIPRGIAEQEIECLLPDAGTPIILYCKSGNRSALVAENLGRMGYSRVKSLAGGVAAWIEEGRAVVEAAADNWLALVKRQVQALNFGSVGIIVHDGRVTQIETSVKVRLDKLR